jgi:peroxin-12
MYDRLCHLFITVYPWIKSALDFWTLLLQFSYLLSKSDVHSPMLRFAGVHLETLTAEDYARFGKDVSGQQSSNIG